MILNNWSFRKVTIIGVGLMGGSLGLALKKHQLAREIVGLSQKQSTLVNAMKMKAIDIGFTDVRKAVNNADLVILSTPVEAIKKLLPAIAPHLKRGCIVTDMGSAKADIVEEAEKVLPQSVFFVGSHPMVGSEKKGVDFAQENLFENSLCLMTPTPKTHAQAKDRVTALWTKLGVRVKYLPPEEHDKILAYVSHLPHLVAFALMGTIPQEFLEFGASGLRDTTRVASSSPQMWHDICFLNSKNIVNSLDEFVKSLSELRKAIVDDDQNGLLTYFTKSKEKRDGLLQQ
ncbi:MAG: prephenate dehydrogenase [Candidatus Omnitrophica bacterium]|nr:prephenate dehydrogenase [Candidatus Omnitrophota bacterium]